MLARLARGGQRARPERVHRLRRRGGVGRVPECRHGQARRRACLPSGQVRHGRSRRHPGRTRSAGIRRRCWRWSGSRGRRGVRRRRRRRYLDGVQKRRSLRTAQSGNTVPACRATVPTAAPARIVASARDVAEASGYRGCLIDLRVQKSDQPAHALPVERDQSCPQGRHRAGTPKDDRLSVDERDVPGGGISISGYVGDTPTDIVIRVGGWWNTRTALIGGKWKHIADTAPSSPFLVGQLVPHGFAGDGRTGTDQPSTTAAECVRT